jgi:hypothetical protein
MFQNIRTLAILLERFQCTPLSPKLIFWVFSHHFGDLQRLFGFAPHTLCLKLVFRVVSGNFVAAPDPLWKSVSGAFNAWVYASESISCFSQRTCAIHYFKSKTHVLGGSKPFRSRTWYVAKIGIELHLMHEFMPLEPFLFLQQTSPFHYFRSKTHVLDGFAPIRCRTWPVAKICIGVHLMLEFMPPKPFLVWSQWTCSIHNFRSKNHVYNSAW